MTDIARILTRERVSCKRDAEGWKDAIRIAGQYLIDDGIAGDSYSKAMIATVEEKGPYIVLAPGFAFAHARPDASVKHTGMSWIKLASPVEFGHPKNDPVRHVVALAATDSKSHVRAMSELAALVGDPAAWSAIDAAASDDALYAAITAAAGKDSPEESALISNRDSRDHGDVYGPGSRKTRDHILTVCGNGLGTSLFLKNTLEKVLDAWGWGPFITVEATDTISAKGKAKEADCILTSGEIARTLGDLGVPLKVIENFTSTQEIDAALRELYDI